MAKVYMIHYEHGQYSDWCYCVVGIFSSLEKAKDFMRSIEVDVAYDRGSNWCRAYGNWKPSYYECYGKAHAVDKPDGTWTLECDGMDVEYNGYEVTYYITEYEMDNGIAGGNPAMSQ